MKQKIVITNFYSASSLALHHDQAWEALAEGKSGIAPITAWDVEGWKYAYGAEVKDYRPRTMVDDRKMLKIIEKQDVLGLYSLREMMAGSGIEEYRESFSEEEEKRFALRSGIFAAACGGTFSQQYDLFPLLAETDNMQEYAEKLFQTIHPMWILKTLPNNVLAYAGIKHRFRGPNQNFVNHSSSSLQALSEACHAIEDGRLDRALIVAYDAALDPQQQMYYAMLGTLSPEESIHPYDQKRQGTVLGEGAGCLLIESEQAAQERGAKPLFEVLGHAHTSEAKGLFSIDPEGSGVSRAITKTLEKAEISPDEVGMITGHGNGTQLSDTSEAAAIATCFGEKTPPVTSFKWALGHTLAASGIIETIHTMLSLQKQRVPKMPTLEHADPVCQKVQLATEELVPASDSALVINRGFGSFNSCLALKCLS